MDNQNWESVIGLEVHVQLRTASKIFAATSAAYGAQPNMQACALSIALPGTLPVMNMQAARLAVRFGLSINAHINHRSVFARKHYFYPDLPKGYQISQYELPIVGRGDININTEYGVKTIGITRAHLEEDAGKSMHEEFADTTALDLNRAGTPLLEIVSEPDMRTPTEAADYLRKIRALVRYLSISDGNMQEGSLRCDANVSIRPTGQRELGTRTELKNINSFKFVEKAIAREIERQIEQLENGKPIIQETRLYDVARDQTRPMRSKEDAHDYRYFPDPDLPELLLSEEFIEEVRAQLPELPDVRAARLQSGYGLSERDAANLTMARETADYFEETMRVINLDNAAKNNSAGKIVANWLLGEMAGALNKHDLQIQNAPINPAQLGALINRITDNTISGKTAKQVFEALWHGDGEVDDIIEARGLKQVTDQAEIESLITQIVHDHPQQVQQYRDGKQKVFGFFVGQVMKASGGKASPAQVNEILRNKLA